MKGFSKFFVLTALVAIAAFGAFAQSSASDDGTAQAEIIQALTLTYDTTSPLEFGMIVQPASVQTVTVATDGTVTSTDSTILLPDTTTTAAKFDATGQAARTFDVTLPSSIPIRNAALDTMYVTALTDSCSGTCTLDGSGASTFYVGGTLNVGGAQPTGSYSGAFTVTVNYP